MRGPAGGAGTDSAGGAGFGGPILFVFLIMLIGATLFLWRMRYVRRKTAFVIIAILGLALIYSGITLRTYGA